MKKYTSGAFQTTTYGIYKSAQDTITSFPAEIIGNGGNITPWSIYGNTSAGQSVGEKTNNLWNEEYTDMDATVRYTPIAVGEGKFTLSSDIPNYNSIASIFLLAGDVSTGATSATNGVWANHSNTVDSIDGYITIAYRKYSGAESLDECHTILNVGQTALSYEPYGYKLPVVIGSTTTNIYMADVLRMSSGADPVYDVMSSTGTITRNVDTDGSPLPTPTTESFTAPTLATVAGSQSFTINTTVKPSSVSLTYTGWHTHTDKQYSGGSWGQVTSNAKVLRRKKSAKSKT